MHSLLRRISPSAASLFFSVFLTLLTAGSVSVAQQPHARITSAIETSNQVTLPGSRPVRALPENDLGAVADSTLVEGMTLVFSRSAAQENDLQGLLAAQQNPVSPLYHQWLTPDEFAVRFGMAESDIQKSEAWLQQQGFTVEGVSRSRDRIFFSGTAGQVAYAFKAELHHFRGAEKIHFAPAADLNLPAALASVVTTVGNLSDFRPYPHVRLRPASTVEPNFTVAGSGEHFLTPKDVATIYDINAAYNAGYTGSGQSIAVVGQSAVVTTDITNFQSAAGLTAKAPTLILMPNTGTSTVVSGDEVESDLDLEYTGGIARDASIIFVYTGSNQNYGVFDALEYAVDNKTAPILSISYGTCESELTTADYSTLNGILAQAAAQGQTVIAASGDDGSTDCYENTDETSTVRKSLAVDFPSDSQYVTGLGGSEFTSAAVASSNTTYWTANSGSDAVSSARSYMPEQVWNDDSSTYGLGSGGGGVSMLTSRPSWQTGVSGIASGSYRLVPDIALAASPENAGYLYCSSDSKDTGITGSCSNGFRDSSGTHFTVAGGTSFAAPVFAGMLAILNQAKGSSGEGVINATLYGLAANSTTYASAFHDITAGSNACTAGSTYCSTVGASAYSAGTGYDEATGLGSIDLYNLLNAWITGSSTTTTAASTTTLAAATLTPGNGASDLITITVASGSVSKAVVPTGTLSVAVDGSVVNATLALSSGVAVYTFQSSTAGSHTVTAAYSGDSNFASSTGSLTLTVGAAGSKSFTLSASSLTLSDGSSGSGTLTVTPASGYTGTVTFSVTANSSLTNACFVLPNATVSGSAAVSTTLTVYTSASACSVSGTALRAANAGSHSIGNRDLPLVLFAGLLVLPFLRRRTRCGRMLRGLAGIAMLVVLGLAATGCGSGGSAPAATTNSTYSPQGSYTLTVTGKDSVSSSIASSTTLVLTVN